MQCEAMRYRDFDKSSGRVSSAFRQFGKWYILAIFLWKIYFESVKFFSKNMKYAFRIAGFWAIFCFVFLNLSSNFDANVKNVENAEKGLTGEIRDFIL